MTYDPATYWSERLEKHFDSVGVGHIGKSASYNNMIYRVRKHRLHRTIQSLGVSLSSSRVLDIGSGTGFFVDCFYQWGVQNLVGLDITDISVTTLQEKYPQFDFYRQDISASMDTESLGQFDVINCFDVLIHIVDPEKFNTALQNISQLLKPGGYFIFSDVLGTQDASIVPHVTFRSLKTYQHQLEPQNVILHSLHPLLRWSFVARPWLVSLFDRFPVLPEILDKYAQPLHISRIRLAVFRKQL